MSVGSVSANPLAAAAYGASAPVQERRTSETAETGRSIADHVAAADEHEPVRSFNSKLGTMVDTYL